MDSFGLERSIEPRHALAQQAWKIDNTMTLRSDEVLIDVKIININLASFNEILDETGEDRALLCQRVLEIVRERGKLHRGGVRSQLPKYLPYPAKGRDHISVLPHGNPSAHYADPPH